MLFPELRLFVQRLHERIFASNGVKYRELLAEELGEDMTLGWELVIAPNVTAQYQLSSDAPYGTPTVWIIAPAEARTIWQHVELDGKVCLLEPGHSSMPLIDGRSVDNFLQALLCVIKINAGTPPEADPVTARHRWVDTIERAWSLLDPPDCDTRAVAARLYRRQWVIASTREQLDAWMKQHRDWPPDEIVDACTICLHHFADVPRDASELNPKAQSIVEHGGLVVFVLPTATGPMLLGIRRQESGSLLRFRVDRADREWIHGRGGNGLHINVAGAHVALVGCGSLGSGVAELLVRAGVGRLTLIDPDHLSWDNAARHSLGGSAVGRAKAVALARRLQQQLPTTPCVTGLPQTWQHIAERRPNQLAANVIVSTIASWPQELALAEWSRRRGIPMVAGWVESRAAASHAISLRCKCLACLFNPRGRFLREISRWKRGSAIQLTEGCHEHFLPYGYADIVPTHAMITRLVLDVLTGEAREATHRSIVLSALTLNSLGAVPTTYAIHAYEPRPSAVQWAEYRQEWPVNPHCWHCGGRG